MSQIKLIWLNSQVGHPIFNSVLQDNERKFKTEVKNIEITWYVGGAHEVDGKDWHWQMTNDSGRSYGEGNVLEAVSLRLMWEWDIVKPRISGIWFLKRDIYLVDGYSMFANLCRGICFMSIHLRSLQDDWLLPYVHRNVLASR